MKSILLFSLLCLLAACQTSQKACVRHPIQGNAEFLQAEPPLPKPRVQ